MGCVRYFFCGLFVLLAGANSLLFRASPLLFSE